RLRVAEGFYGLQRASEEELKTLLAKATIANLTGKRVVKIAVEMGLVDPENVLVVAGVPHAQMARML
ncbi:MAG: DUF424 domain-containing protein, partial [Candidatus Thermoplasmatota archaeon]|nr:DUF424 domain-containing protein [Candidatus Thermoplasmatota archaeon]